MDFHQAKFMEKRSKVMSPEQFNQVVQAITEGRYSWACVLILLFAGYNPVYFIPYRTYSRLIKENRLLNSTNEPHPHQIPTGKEHSAANSNCSMMSKQSVQINELTHPESIDDQEGDLQGGLFPHWAGEEMALLKSSMNRNDVSSIQHLFHTQIQQRL